MDKVIIHIKIINLYKTVLQLSNMFFIYKIMIQLTKMW